MQSTEVPPSDVATADLVQGMVEAFNDHKPDLVASICAEDVTWVDPLQPAPLIGRRAVMDHLLSVFRAFPDMHLGDTLLYRSPDPERVALRWHLTATMTGPLNPPGFRATGKPVEMDGISFYDFAGGKVGRKVMLFNALGLARQLGSLPSGDRLAVRLQHMTVGWRHLQSRLRG